MRMPLNRSTNTQDVSIPHRDCLLYLMATLSPGQQAIPDSFITDYQYQGLNRLRNSRYIFGLTEIHRNLACQQPG